MVRPRPALLAAHRESRVSATLGRPPRAAEGAQSRRRLDRARPGVDRSRSSALAALAVRRGPGGGRHALADGERLEAPLAPGQLHRRLPPAAAGSGALSGEARATAALQRRAARVTVPRIPRPPARSRATAARPRLRSAADVRVASA